MAQINAMRQIGVKNMGNRVEFMEWSNKMDLVAIGNEKGEIIIQRLNFQKICSFPPPGENIKIRMLSWQPDEAIIAVAYSSGKIALLDIETEEEIYAFLFPSDIKTISWTRSVQMSKFTDTYENKSETNHEDFLSPLPSLESISTGARKTEYNTLRNFAKKTPNFLVISLLNGNVCLSVFGVLPCGVIDVTKYVSNQQDFEIYDVQMSSSFDEIFVFVRDGQKLKNLILKNSILSKYTSSLLNLATKHGYILETLNYINDTIQCIIEAWEIVLLEMDNKLTKYISSQPEGSLSADFLELLLFGYPSESLEQFLTRDLTEKGLKKLANSIEISYTTIQNLIIKSLHTAAINLFFHLNVLKGLSKNTYCYKALITPESVQNAFLTAGSFLLKMFELQQILDQSVSDYKIFCCWLCVVIVRLMEENVSDEAASVSQEDILYLAEFLNTFDDYVYEKEDGTMAKRQFNLERVGQYLENCNLQFPSKNDSQHQWTKFLEENDCIRESGYIFPINKETSLIQQFNALKNAITELFLKPSKIIEENFVLQCTINCSSVDSTQQLFTSYIVDEKTASDILVSSISENELIFLELNSINQTIKSAQLDFSCEPSIKDKFRFFDEITLKHMQFYNESTLSLLLLTKSGEKSSTYFVQLPLDDIREKCFVHKNSELIELSSNCKRLCVLEFIDPSFFKPIEGLTNTQIAVSGSRKVTSILSENCRKIRVFEMEIEDDDDEVDMCAQNISLESGRDSINLQE